MIFLWGMERQGWNTKHVCVMLKENKSRIVYAASLLISRFIYLTLSLSLTVVLNVIEKEKDNEYETASYKR